MVRVASAVLRTFSAAFSNHTFVSASDRRIPERSPATTATVQGVSRAELQEAASRLGEMLTHFPDDGPTQIFMERVLEFTQQRRRLIGMGFTL